MKEKVDEICNLIPAFKKEINWSKGVTLEGKDYAKYTFKNGSYFDNIAARESSRGKRRHAGVVEECVGVDGDILSQVIIPTMNVSRRCMDGTTHPEEQLNKSQLYITTAGYKNSFPYDKLIQILVWQIVKPQKAMVLGGTYKIPVLVHLLDKNFVADLKMDGTFNETSFAREYESKWAGSTENAFFNAEIFERHRILKQPEYEVSGRSSKGSYYLLSVDVGRKGDNTVVEVFKVTPQPQGASIKSLVNIYSLTDTHFEDQAIGLKKLYYKYKAKRIVIDGNGLGIGLLDYMVKSQINPDTNEVYPDFGVYNDKDGEYKKYKSKVCEEDAIYIIKATAPINTEAHANCQTQLSSGKVKFLIDERTAKAKLLGTKVGQNMTPEKRNEYLRPFTLTSILQEEMLNLKEENEGVNIILKQANKGIKKDKFSASTKKGENKMDLYTIARKKGTGAIIWSEDQKQYIKQEYVNKDRTLKSLALEFQVQPQSIRNLLRKMKIKITNKKISNYPRFSNYFINIDTREKAYWLGMFYADGCVHSNSNEISIGLKDQEHIEKFKQAIGAINNKITIIQDNRFDKPCMRYDFSLRDAQIHNDLIKWGCVPRKSYVKELHFPDISTEFLWDFVRGYFDGDGSIYWSKNNNNYIISWTGNKYFLQDIRTLCEKEKISIQQNVKSKITYQFRLSGKDDVKRILLNMYQYATKETVLERKLINVNSCLISLGASPLNL